MFGELDAEKKSGLVYSAAVVAPVFLSLVFFIVLAAAGITIKSGETPPDWYLYCSFLVSPLGFSVVVAAYFSRTKEPIKNVAGRCAAKYFFLAIALQIGLLSLSELNALFLKFLGRFGYESEINLPSLNGAGLFGVLFVVAVLPAVLEELVFRGLLLEGLKNFGSVAAVLVCGALFSLYHQNPAQTVYQFLCGAGFALVALKAGSALPTMLAHFLNNAFIIIAQKLWGGELPRPAQIPLLVVSVICLLGSLVWLIFFDKRGKGALSGDEGTDRTAGKKADGKTDKKADKKGFFLFAALGIVVCAVMWLSALVSGLGG